SRELFGQHLRSLTEVFREFYPPERGQNTTLRNRVLDCARYFLLLGQSSGITFEDSARDWSRLIGEFKDAPIPSYRQAAALIERLLTPSEEEEAVLGFKAEAPSSIRHTEPTSWTNENLMDLKNKHFPKFPLEPNIHFKGRVEQGVTLLSKQYTE